MMNYWIIPMVCEVQAPDSTYSPGDALRTYKLGWCQYRKVSGGTLVTTFVPDPTPGTPPEEPWEENGFGD